RQAHTPASRLGCPDTAAACADPALSEAPRTQPIASLRLSPDPALTTRFQGADYACRVMRSPLTGATVDAHPLKEGSHEYTRGVVPAQSCFDGRGRSVDGRELLA